MEQIGTSTSIFQRNHLAIRIIAPILAAEQLLYGLLFSSPGSLPQSIYIYSSLLLLIISIISFIITSEHQFSSLWLRDFYSASLLLLGLVIALIRMLSQPGPLYSLPTVYLAVLYGGAVVLILPYLQSALLYGGITIISAVLVGHYRELLPGVPVRADLIINGLIAWVMSAMNYRNYLKLQVFSHLTMQQNRELQDLSYRDWLTGLYNRRRVDELLHKPHRFTSLILMDLDHFKHINDTYGHHRGDEVLKEISRLLETHTGTHDLCSRWGGEEFLILTSHPGESLAEQLRRIIAASSFSDGLTLTGSFGVAHFSESPDVDKLLFLVDGRLYQAKETGRNRVVSPSTHQSQRQD